MPDNELGRLHTMSKRTDMPKIPGLINRSAFIGLDLFDFLTRILGKKWGAHLLARSSWPSGVRIHLNPTRDVDPTR